MSKLVFVDIFFLNFVVFFLQLLKLLKLHKNNYFVKIDFVISQTDFIDNLIIIICFIWFFFFQFCFIHLKCLFIYWLITFCKEIMNVYKFIREAFVPNGSFLQINNQEPFNESTIQFLFNDFKVTLEAQSSSFIQLGHRFFQLLSSF